MVITTTPALCGWRLPPPRGTAVNYAALGPKIPEMLPDTAAVRVNRCAVMTDLNFANEAVVTMSISPRDSKHASLLLVLSIAPDTLEIRHVVALQHGTQTAVPLHHVPGVCVDIAQTKVRSLFGVAPVGFGA